jgi:hypothetical protein
MKKYWAAHGPVGIEPTLGRNLNIFANNFPTPDPKIVNFCVQIHNNFWIWSRKVICKYVYLMRHNYSSDTYYLTL